MGGYRALGETLGNSSIFVLLSKSRGSVRVGGVRRKYPYCGGNFKKISIPTPYRSGFIALEYTVCFSCQNREFFEGSVAPLFGSRERWLRFSAVFLMNVLGWFWYKNES